LHCPSFCSAKSADPSRLAALTCAFYDRVVPALEAIVRPAISPWDLLGLELHLLEAVAARRSAPVLVLYATTGCAVSIGRYHLYGGRSDHDGIVAMRRLTGGRAVGAGDGWLGLALVLPHWGALLPERDAHLKPEQVLNRYARGVLAGLRTLGLECFYPGRDAITIDRREVAMCTFETDDSGALMFEASIAVNRGMEELSRDLDSLDPAGTVPSVVHSRETSSTLERELRREIGLAEVADAIVRGYGEAFGEVRERGLADEEIRRAVESGKALQSIHWLRRVADASEYNRSSRMTAQLGQIEAWLGVSADNRIERLMLSGDLIGNSSGIALLEAALEGQTHDLIAVSNSVARVFSADRNFILGFGELSNLVRLVVEAR
jgi:lipoate-protein ligase A